MGQAAEHPEAAIHQAQREGISSDHINGTKGGMREVPLSAVAVILMCLQRLCFKVKSGRRHKLTKRGGWSSAGRETAVD